MRKLIVGLAMGFAFLSFGVAQAEGYLRFDGIDGDVAVENYEGWSEFTSLAHKIVPPLNAKGELKRRKLGTFEQFAVIKPPDKSSPKIAHGALIGRIYPSVEIVWVIPSETGVVPYYRYTLINAWVLEIESKGFHDPESAAGDSLQIEDKIVLDFEEMMVTYWDYDANGEFKGAIEYSWKE